MNWKAFNQLLKKYVEGKCTEEEKLIVDQWYELLSDESKKSLEPRELEDIKSRLWQKVQLQKQQPAEAARTKTPLKRIWLRVAAAAILIGVIVTFSVVQNKNTQSFVFGKIEVPIDEMIVKKNSSEKPLIVRLEEGTEITLQPRSQVRYPIHFNADKREVYFEGNGFFNVSKNPQRPFYVYANNLVTQVLGTSFHVHSVSATGLVEVAVATGKVAVYENEKGKLKSDDSRLQNEGVLLTPNQKVTYYAREGHFVTSLVETPVPLVDNKEKDTKQSYVFEEESLSVVLSRLERTYGIEIVVENENLNNCPFTGDLTEQDLYNKLELVCKSIGAYYEVKGTTIIIKGKGCK